LKNGNEGVAVKEREYLLNKLLLVIYKRVSIYNLEGEVVIYHKEITKTNLNKLQNNQKGRKIK
jgi:hypothetical protein